jgi:glycosyltransferase involved in cell wall biosynthesis
MEPRLDRAAARQLLGLPADQRLVLYAGHVGRDKGIETLVETAARLPDATFLLLGASPDRGGTEWIEGLARRAEASNIVLRPRVPAVDVAPYLYAADCLVVPPYDDPARRYRWRMLPIKVYSYLAAGRPIVAPKLPDIEEVLNDRVARLVPSLDATAWASAIADVLNDRALQEELGASARAASMNFTWAGRARLIVDFLRTL